MTCSLGDIAEHIGAELHGDNDCLIRNISTLEDADSDSISFLSNHRYIKQLRSTRASAVILAKEHLDDCPSYALVTDNPYLGYALAARMLYPQTRTDGGIHPAANVHESASVDTSAYICPNAVIEQGVVVDANAYIGPSVIIGRDSVVGKDTRILANTVICNSVIIGSSVLIHPGVVIGADGFGFAEKPDGGWIKIPQIGSVLIRDDVEIGSNTTIDRGALGNTVIERGVKIDNQVQIGHNVYIGEYTAIAGCTGIAGSATIGKRCRIGGACGISGHLEIADDVILTAMSAVNNSILKSGVYSSPLSITDNRTWRRNVARFHRLDESFRKIREEIRQIKKN
ncbi:MAG: UDP-3-O-(3-hydroxymyristoyl)glucosamine N-acyltransferase [Gammaproteobacteria bacterium]|nr:UDP-3-O-(3-hydroxymyristoyl)glucosamine N-acyltransferase [Gammaproteobacteria bacterium]